MKTITLHIPEEGNAHKALQSCLSAHPEIQVEEWGVVQPTAEDWDALPQALRNRLLEAKGRALKGEGIPLDAMWATLKADDEACMK